MSEWKEKTLNEVCQKITDGSHYSPIDVNSGYPMLSVKDMREYDFDFSSCKHISFEDFCMMRQNDCIPQVGDVLVAKDGSYLKEIFCCKEYRDIAILSSIAIFRPNQSIILPSFLCYLLKTSFIFNYISKNCVSGSALPRIVLKSFKDVRIPVPDLFTQSKIAGILSSLDAKIETNNKLNEKLEEMAQAIFKSWFVDFEPFKNQPFHDTELGMIPEGWEVYMASELYKINIGKTPPRKESKWFSLNHNDIKWISISDLGKSGIFILDSSEKLTKEAINKHNIIVVPKNTILLSFKLTIGRVAICNSEMTTNEAIARFYLNDESDMEYLFMYLKNYNFDLLGSTSSIATAVNSKIIKKMPILKPSSEVINEFHCKINPLFEMIRTNIEENACLASLRDTLLPRLMSGEIKI